MYLELNPATKGIRKIAYVRSKYSFKYKSLLRYIQYSCSYTSTIHHRAASRSENICRIMKFKLRFVTRCAALTSCLPNFKLSFKLTHALLKLTCVCLKLTDNALTSISIG